MNDSSLFKMEQVFGNWISVTMESDSKPFSKIFFSVKVQVLTCNLWNVREKSSSCIFHFPRNRAGISGPSQPRRITGKARRKENKELWVEGMEEHVYSQPWTEGSAELPAPI